MVLRSLLPALLAYGLLAHAADWDCHASVSSYSYDLTSLAGEHKISTEPRKLPPSTMVEELKFDLCKPVQLAPGVPSGDQCPEGTFACITTTNKKTGADDRVVSVIPVASVSTLDPTFTPFSPPKDGLSILFHGPPYPESSSPVQTLNITLRCADGTSDPTFLSYASNTATVEWKTKAACGTKGTSPPVTEPPPGGTPPPAKKSGSGIGWFFLLLIVCFGAYLGVGAYYNYNNYGASGWDLMPHRDFWRDVPHLLKDVVSHLFSSVRSNRGGGRGGYVSV